MNLVFRLWNKVCLFWTALIAVVAGQAPYFAWLLVLSGVLMLSRASRYFAIGGSIDYNRRTGGAVIYPHAPGVGVVDLILAVLLLAVGGHALWLWLPKRTRR